MKMETQEKLLKETVSLPDLIVWAQSAGIHPTLIVSLVESSSQATEVEASQYLQEAQEYLVHAQECFSQGDRSKADH